MPVIELENVGKVFRIHRGAGMLLGRGGLGDWVRGRANAAFAALRDITFTVEAGESVGIIGANGSGKSTLLKILAGVTAPSTGKVTVRGRVASLLELGAGFHPLLTGRENVYLNGRILGMSRADVDREFERIIAFSGIEEFLDNPIDTYSSGMFVRLGFAVAVHSNPDVFLVDEVLSVGDEDFQRKCRERINELREAGKTILFVSHDLSIVNTLCNRVILLSGGRMIVRPTPQETIDYYLRQVGRKQGIHAFASDRVEAVFSHGRLSIYHDEHEVTASSGAQVHVRSLGQVHPSTAADWQVTERGPGRCVAAGKMPRLPLTQHWTLKIEENRLTWFIAIEVEKPVPISGIDVNLYLPQRYTRWHYGEDSGSFPEILPHHHDFLPVAPSDRDIRRVAVEPAAHAEAPRIIARLASQGRSFLLQWVNSDYVMGCRVLQALAHASEEEAHVPAGRHPLAVLELDVGVSREAVLDLARAFQTSRTVTRGALTYQFDRGLIRLLHDGEELTREVHVYTSMYIHNFWNDSPNLHWGPPTRDGSVLRVSGRSRRFPFIQHWVITPVDEGFMLDVTLEALETVDVQEYHASIGLRPEYDRWVTEGEQGTFPEFDPANTDWVHLNKDYSPGRRIEALSSSLPSVILEVAAGESRFSMTALNTGYTQCARVLQALCSPKSGRLVFDPGRHNLFCGKVYVNRPS
jgi:ABC-type polysaccharide/polyol phosphate transport system ATPase subunit